MNIKQIKWASQHDWFIKTNGLGVVVREFILVDSVYQVDGVSLVDGVYEESVIQIDDFKELKEWAGY